jgi:hypothetical protein
MSTRPVISSSLSSNSRNLSQTSLASSDDSWELVGQNSGQISLDMLQNSASLKGGKVEDLSGVKVEQIIFEELAPEFSLEHENPLLKGQFDHPVNEDLQPGLDLDLKKEVIKNDSSLSECPEKKTFIETLKKGGIPDMGFKSTALKVGAFFKKK